MAMASRQCGGRALSVVKHKALVRPEASKEMKPVESALVEMDGVMATDHVIPFGEYKGRILGSLPSGYLGWMANNLKFREDTRKLAQLAEGVLKLRRQYINADVDLKYRVVRAVDRSLMKASTGAVLRQLTEQDVSNPDLIYGSLLRRCCQNKSLEEGRIVHKHLVDNKLMGNRYLGNMVLNMYVKCGKFPEARAVFDSLVSRNDRTYGIMIAACVRGGKPVEALELWEKMEADGIVADRFVVTSVIGACARLGALEEGRALHEHLIVTGYKTDKPLETAILQMYAKCGSLEDARRVFEGMEHKDLFCWSAMISAYARAGQGEISLVLYKRMLAEGVEPNVVTYASALGGCASVGALVDGRAIHQRILTSKVAQDDVLQDALLNMYLKCGEVGEARGIFEGMRARNIRSYTAMMSAYVQNGDYNEALLLYTRMREKEDRVEANAFTFATLLGAAEGLGDIEQGKEFHAKLAAKGFSNNVVIQNALMTMYGKCGSPLEAKKVFDSMAPGSRNVISWTSMIIAYAQHGYPQEALELFKQMDVQPSAITFSSVLGACSLLGALEEGRAIHKRMVAGGYKSAISLMNMYARCGSVADARRIFRQLKFRDTFSCNAMLAAYSQHGNRRPLRFYSRMEQEGIPTDEATFASVLAVCSHARLPKASRDFFQSLVVDHGLSPGVEHYLLLVDVLARAGKLEDAEDLIESMPFEADAIAWMALLTGCRLHRDMERGRKAAEKLFVLAPREPLPYILLFSMYSEANRLEEAVEVRKKMESQGVVAKFSSYVEVGDEPQRFTDGQCEAEKDCPKLSKVRSLLMGLLEPMKQAGYVPNTKEVMDDVSEEVKERTLCFHSERLAVAYGLVASDENNEQPLRVIHSSRVCSDCHAAIKIMSSIVEKKIIVRDVRKFHHFDAGSCSCGDLW